MAQSQFTAARQRLAWLGVLTLLVSLVAAWWQPPHPDPLRDVGPWDFTRLDWWGYPVERNAFLRPDPIGGDLRDLHVAPGPQGPVLWAVGDGGRILRLPDGGEGKPEPLEVSQATQDNTLRRLHLVDDRHGWAVGDDGAIVATADGGKTWQRQASGTTQILFGLHFRDARIGWAVGAGGTLLATTDGGASWQAQETGVSVNLTAIQFADDAHGWIVGLGGTILASRDGGQSWERQPSGIADDLYAVRFLDAQTGWAVGDNGVILATRDGGQSWQRQTSGTAVTLFDVYFLDVNRGWAVGERGTVLATRDGGRTWQPQAADLGVRTSLWAVRFLDAQRGWAAGTGGTVLATTDGGATWRKLHYSPKLVLEALQMRDARRGWAAGEAGILLQTEDGGRTWQVRAGGANEWLHDIHFHDERRGIAVGDEGSVLTTADGGRTWQPGRLDAPAVLLDLHFPDRNLGWAAGVSGAVYRTEDGGERWRRLPFPTRNVLHTVHMFNEGAGLVAGGDGIFATRNGGRKWDTVYRSPGTQILALSFTDAVAGWAVGQGGLLLQTRDAGRTWAQVDLPLASKPWLLDVHFPNAQDGWAVGTQGTLIRTRDGGATWTNESEALKTLTTLFAVHFADEAHGCVVGRSFAIRCTANGGASWYAPEYRIDPAPWTQALALFGLALAGWALWPGVRGTATAAGIASRLANDQPLDPARLPKDWPDHGKRRRFAQALTEFLLNRETEPSLTLAVTGQWGSGKTSVLRLMEAELKQANFYTAWFNAWHHQIEGRQLLSMLHTVRKRAVPAWYTWRGLIVRLRLIWGRGLGYRVLLGVTLVLLATGAVELSKPQARREALAWLRHALVGDAPLKITPASLAQLHQDKSLDDGVFKALCETLVTQEVAASAPKFEEQYGCKPACQVSGKDCRFDSPEQFYTTLEQAVLAPRVARAELHRAELTSKEKAALDAAAEKQGLALPGVVQIALVLLLLFLGKGWSVYGLQLTEGIKHLWPELAKAIVKEPIGTVEHYRREFCLLTEALGGRLVLFIDDLDRCDCQAAREILEHINYLASEGKCFIVLGLAMEPVLDCLGRNGDGGSSGQNGAVARRSEALHYLKKIINIEIPLLPLDSAALLEVAQQGQDLQSWAVFADRVKGLGRFALAAAFALGLVHAFSNWVGPWLYPDPAPKQVTRLDDTRLLPNKGRSIRDTGGSRKSTKKLASVEKSISGKDGGQTDSTEGADRDDRRVSVALLAGVSLALLLTLIVLRAYGTRLAGLADKLRKAENVAVRLLRRFLVALGLVLRAQDPPEFRSALDEWKDVIAHAEPTPRGVKRFINRVRILASLDKNLLGDGGPPLDAAKLVALAAIHHACKGLPPERPKNRSEWDQFISSCGSDTSHKKFSVKQIEICDCEADSGQAQAVAACRDAICIKTAEYDRVLRLIGGIHVH